MEKEVLIEEMSSVLVAAIESASFTVSGPTDPRVAENGEPGWVCKARLLIAEAGAQKKVQESGMPDGIDPADIRIETFPLKAAGGFALMRDIGVRITHIPTGIHAEASEDRSQHRNRYEAMVSLTEKVAAFAATKPTIGDKWPGTEAIYAGKALSRDGSKIIDLIVWLDSSDKKRPYADNVAYCESVSPETGSHSATRQQAIVINDNLRHLFKEHCYYWTETKDNAGDAAFVQYFDDGSQVYTNLRNAYRALAVSEID